MNISEQAKEYWSLVRNCRTHAREHPAIIPMNIRQLEYIADKPTTSPAVTKRIPWAVNQLRTVA